MSNRYLLEVGTEELPVGFLLSAPVELTEKVQTLLTENGLLADEKYGDVKVYATPRRLALVVDGLNETQPDRAVQHKGPPVRVALGPDGQPTQAGLGFARKMGVDFGALTRETIEGEEYVVLNQQVQGRPTRDILAERLPEVVLSLSGSHFMAWGANTIRFSRPIRWLVSLWNDTHLSLSIGPVASGVESRGHRVLAEGPVRIPSVDGYLTALEQEGFVQADQNRRREAIWQALQETAQSVGGTVPENPELLDTVTMLVEHPSVVAGRFEERFLEIPAEVTTTVMKAHQKYFPVQGRQANELLPYFLTVSNGLRESADSIRHGNEKVLTARFQDASFFFNEDQKKPLETRLEDLKGVTFQKGLGSMYQKTHRLVALAERIAQAVQAPQALTHRAALLAKADLVTGMVFEFTELQGVMGSKYATLAGEPPEVSQAIYEHYLPRFLGDDIARTPVGIAVSLADKLDTMMAVFSQKNAKLPSGSKDPMGLRRMAAGVILTVMENRLPVDIVAMLEAAYDGLGDLVTQERAEAMALVNEFILQRLKGALLDQNIRYDIIDAVLQAENPLRNLPDALTRLETLKALSQNEAQLKRIYEPANRISKILGDKYQADVSIDAVDAAHFRHDSEGELLNALKALHAVPVDGYSALIEAMAGMEPTVEAFFNGVLVNDPDEAIRKNRYNLLSLLNTQYLRLARFSSLVV